jgi:hypothetical protein
MRRLMLGVAMVMICSYNHAQENDENDIPIKTLKESKPMEWFILKTDDAKMIYGSKFEINAVVYNWFDAYGLDITSPHKEKMIKGKSVQYWYTKNRFGDDLEVAFYDHENSKTFKVRVIH